MGGTPRYIFDFGANRGQNLEYYLSRAEKVVAVEANPVLCAEIQAKFSAEIAEGSLIVENVAITDSSEVSGQEVEFFVHNNQSILSQFPQPVNLQDFSRITISSMSASAIVRKYVPEEKVPLFIKVDLEGYDSQVLKDLFHNNVFPEFVSAESHTIETFAALINSDQYNSFSLVPGNKVHLYNWRNEVGHLYNFAPHSAGPFGSDVCTEWYDSHTFFQVLGYEKLGWKDIHASKNDVDSLKTLKPSYVLKKEFEQFSFTLYRLLVPLLFRKRISRTMYLMKLFPKKLL